VSVREARIHPRVPAQLAVRFVDGQDFRAAWVSSLSQGGLFIRTQHPLPIGTDIIMEIELVGDLAPIRMQGKVIWDRLAGRTGGMGIAFTDSIPDRLRKLLTDPGS
jgi:uncharacterized protein (TIGR02266 family)